MVRPRLDIVNGAGGLLERTELLDGEFGRLEEYTALDDVFLVEGCGYLLLPVDLDLGVERGGPGFAAGDGVRGRVYYHSHQHYLSLADRDNPQSGSLPSSMAYKLSMVFTACSAAAIVLLILFNLLFNPIVVGPLSLLARSKKGGP